MCVLLFIYSYVQVFDTSNKTGQETKDGRSKGKIQVVIDWPMVLASEEAKVTNFLLRNQAFLVTTIQA